MSPFLRAQLCQTAKHEFFLTLTSPPSAPTAHEWDHNAFRLLFYTISSTKPRHWFDLGRSVQGLEFPNPSLTHSLSLPLAHLSVCSSNCAFASLQPHLRSHLLPHCATCEEEDCAMLPQYKYSGLFTPIPSHTIAPSSLISSPTR